MSEPNMHWTTKHSLALSKGSEILDEKAFQRMLCLERKRAERSSRRFVLMLLDVTGLLNNGSTPKVLQKILQALSAATRETDIKGWHQDGTVIGVIFTEIGDAEGKVITAALSNRITQTLDAALGSTEVRGIKLAFYVFPEDAAVSGMDEWAQSPLYSDVTQEMNRRNADRFLKRALDVVGSLTAMVLFFPVFTAIALAVKLTSRGPVFFKQERVGQFGKPFIFVKFRSMYTGNDHSIHQQYVEKLIAGAATRQEAGRQAQLYKLTKDPRVTPLGRFLRKTSLDELPQFFNVLKGEMSLVGPRPPIAYEVQRYSIWHRSRLLAVKPGITGLWQVGGRNKVAFDEMVRLDLQYAKSWTLWLDVKILLKTPRAAVMGI